MDLKTHGFTRLCPVDDLWHWIDTKLFALPPQDVPWQNAVGRIAAEPFKAQLLTAETLSATRDGYALCAEETLGAGVYNPLSLTLVGYSAPGMPFQRQLSPGQAVYIAYGATMPNGADAVLPVEHGETHDGWLEVTTAIAPGEYVKRTLVGYNQEPIFEQGHRFRPQDLPALSESGVANLSVHRRPKIRVITTGSELLKGAADQQETPVDCNSNMLKQLVNRDGGELEHYLLLADDTEAIGEALVQPGADLVIITGGSGPGFNDHSAEALAEVGELCFHGIALAIARSSGSGCVDNTPMILLPGNPSSCFVGYDIFAARAIRRLAGLRDIWPYPLVECVTTAKISSGLGRLDYIPVCVEGARVTPLTTGELLRAECLAHAQGFILVLPDSEGFATDATVPVYLY